MKSKATIFTGLFVALALGSIFAWSEWTSVASEPQHIAAVPGETKKVLPAGDFVGQAALGYKAAADCPEIIAKLFCYCGCDMTDSHSSLLDCFTSDHGADCQICTDEAIIAAQMKKLHRTLPQIQLAIDSKYAKEYPFTEPSPALKKYRELALGIKAGNSASTPKLKTGHKSANCCK